MQIIIRPTKKDIVMRVLILSLCLVALVGCETVRPIAQSSRSITYAGIFGNSDLVFAYDLAKFHCARHGRNAELTETDSEEYRASFRCVE